MNIWDWLPQDFWLGPPLPRFLAVLWPWAQSSSATTSPLASLFRGADSPPQITAQILYENEERIKLVRGEDGHITELVINRKVTQDV